jgi:hypothetical protein
MTTLPGVPDDERHRWEKTARTRQTIANIVVVLLVVLFLAAGIAYVVISRSS